MKYLLIITLLITGLVGCRKENAGPQEMYTEYNVFDSLDKNGVAVLQYLNNMYADMPTGFNRVDGDLLESASDDAMPSRYGSTIQYLINGGPANSNNNPEGVWAQEYASIRKVNLFLSKVDRVPKPAEVITWKAEARYLRALAYFELLKRYGGIPLIGDTVYQSTDNIQVRRSSFGDCVSYIVAECDSIKAKVKVEPIAATDFGRASRGAALALKARVLLYAASPLYNGGVTGGASSEQAALQGYPTYDAERWNKAAQAANDLLILNVYSLEPTYNNVFLNRQNKEIILPYLRGTTFDLETINGPVGYSLNSAGNGYTSPTQDLVDAFGMANGKAISDPASGYNPLNPYAGRDPRLVNTVLYNTAPWLSRPLETFEGGQDKPNRGGIQTRTGYYLRKFLGNFASSTQYSAQNHNFPIFRIAETMLNYAEALNEYSGPVTAVYTNLINIRKRAGIAAGSDGKYGLSATLTKDQMREVIRNERRVEMAFEEQRYWDTRRWKIAETVLNKPLSGMQSIKTGTNTFTYQVFTAGQIAFNAPRMYFYPIPFSEITKNNNLIQNYGW